MRVKKLALLALITAVYADQASFAQGPAAPSYTASNSTGMPVSDSVPRFVRNKRELSIPFGVNSPGLQAAVVELYVSRNRGQEWGIVARQSAGSNEFRFSAPDDGTYWFATRTVDASGRAYPVGAKMAAQLEIVVDTSLPELTMTADADASGLVTLDYAVLDISTANENLQLHYMIDTDRTQWHPVDTSRHTTNRDSSGAIHGQITFQPVADYRYINLRLMAVDQAGNQSVQNRQLEKPRLARSAAPGDSGYAVQLPEPPSLNHNVVQPVGQNNYQGQTQSSLAPVRSNPMANSSAAESGYADSIAYNGSLRGLLPAQAQNTPSPKTIANNFPNNVGAIPVSQPNLFVQPQAEPATPSSVMRPIAIEQVPTPSGQAEPARNEPSLSSPQQQFTQPPYTSSRIEASNVPTPVDTRNIPYSPAPVTQTTVVPESEVLHRRSQQFSLHYEVDAVGSKGIRAVELWSTTDGGQTWAMRGADPDNESPFDIETEGPGLYGFGIVVVGGNGLTSPVPQPGEAPDIWVRVDTQSPLVRLNSARYGEGDETGALVIEYSCSDDNLIPRPVSLAFSETPAGPWTTIATGLENTGRYVWPADPRLPRQIFLRIEGQDLAGNIGIEARDTPVSVQGLAPRARIKGLEDIPAESALRASGNRFR